jgi:hypothetical protein
MLFFRSEEHVEAWCNQWKMERGAILSIEQGWRLAQAWYGSDRSKPAWRRKTLDETEALFSELGLTSAFWNLR